MVYKARAGYVRERPLTAPDLSIYLQQDVKREEEISEEKLINVMQQRVRRASRIFGKSRNCFFFLYFLFVRVSVLTAVYDTVSDIQINLTTCMQ